MRCLSIADALTEQGVEMVFFTSDYYSQKMIAKRGFRTICLDNGWNDKDSELDQFIPLLQENHPDLLLIDSYQVTGLYLSEMHRVVKLAYIDDLNAFDYPVDIAINYSVYAEDLDYPPGKTYLLGMKYAPLRKQFDILEDKLKHAVRDRKMIRQILITTGAADPYNVAEKVVRGILKQSELKEYRIAVVKGGFWNTNAFDKDYIDALGENASERVILYENVENMAGLMLASSIAISAGGSTLYELCACHVPTITFSYADNQLGNVKEFAERGIMECAGDARYTDDNRGAIIDKILTYAQDDDIITRVTGKMIESVCGNGAERLAQSLLGRMV